MSPSAGHDRRTHEGRLRPWRDERGQAIPLILLAIIGLLATGMILTQMGRLTELRASAATSADAAALAGADEIAEALEGPAGLLYFFTRTLPPGVRGGAQRAAGDYADANEATLADFRIDAAGPRRIVVRTDTSTERTIGQPAVDDEMADTKGNAEAAAVAEIGFRPPPESGCLDPSSAEFQTAVQEAGVPTPASSGLLEPCRDGVNLRYVNTALLAGVLQLEAAMGEDVDLTAAFVTVGQQFERVARGQSRVSPGASLLHWGLGFEAANFAAIADALAEMDSPPFCQPYGPTSGYFAHSLFPDCGGPYVRPAPPFVGIEVDVRLVDPDGL